MRNWINLVSEDQALTEISRVESVLNEQAGVWNYKGLVFKRRGKSRNHTFDDHLGSHYDILKDGTIIGLFGFDKAQRKKDKALSIHIRLKDEFQRQGYGTLVYDFATMRANAMGFDLLPSLSILKPAKNLWNKRRPDLNLDENVLLEGPAQYGYVPDHTGSGEIPIFQLRSRRDLMAALRSTKFPNDAELRGLVSRGLVLAWDSYMEVHDGVIECFISANEEMPKDDPDWTPLQTEWDAYVYFYADGVAMAPRRAGNFRDVVDNPIIQAIYGKDVPMRDPRPGTL